MKRRKFNFSPLAKQQLRQIDQQNAMQILRKLDRFELLGLGDVKKLVDVHPPELRLRHGDYRVRFHLTARSVEVLSVTNRARSYRG